MLSHSVIVPSSHVSVIEDAADTSSRTLDTPLSSTSSFFTLIALMNVLHCVPVTILAPTLQTALQLSSDVTTLSGRDRSSVLSSKFAAGHRPATTKPHQKVVQLIHTDNSVHNDLSDETVSEDAHINNQRRNWKGMVKRFTSGNNPGDVEVRKYFIAGLGYNVESRGEEKHNGREMQAQSDWPCLNVTNGASSKETTSGSWSFGLKMEGVPSPFQWKWTVSKIDHIGGIFCPGEIRIGTCHWGGAITAVAR
jgi:hypothetical protein